jgi:hypothetical protein
MAALYHERWEIEAAPDELKTHWAAAERAALESLLAAALGKSVLRS